MRCESLVSEKTLKGISPCPKDLCHALKSDSDLRYKPLAEKTVKVLLLKNKAIFLF